MKPKSNADLEIDPDPQLEREADEAATEALAGEPLTINRMGTDVHVQRLGKAVTASTLENIGSLEEDLAALDEQVQEHDQKLSDFNPKDVKGTVNDHDERLSNLEAVDANDIDLKTDTETLLGSEALAEFFSGSGKGSLKRGAAGAAGLIASASVGGLDGGTMAALMPMLASTIVGATADGADAALSESGGATPAAVAEHVEGKLTQSQEFAEKIASNDALAEQLATNEQFLDKIARRFDGGSGLGDSQGVGKGGEVTK
uniref:hypothetical protein n=1 Tax=Natrinema pallidum TaxID=69527 RepID=UPI0006782E1D